MTPFTEYGQYDGMGLAALVAKGEITAAEVCEEAIRRAEALNPGLNAIITPLYDFGREAARQVRPGTPFGGVPFLLKDAHHALQGVAMSCGSALLKDSIPPGDAEIVRRFKNAGLVILGKTNTPEFKLAYVTEPKAFGITRNPWNLDRTPGGSSGGSAAAVAARIVPLASATDEGGSIRVPASYCGLFGLKPSRGRNPVGPDFNEAWDGMSTSHVVTRTVRDSAAMLDAVAGLERGAPYYMGAPQRPFLEEVGRDPGRLKIGFHMQSAFGRQVHPECRKAVERTCALLERLGHDVEEAAPAYREEEVALNWVVVMIGHLTALVDGLVKAHGHRRVKQNIELPNYALYRMGRSMKAVDFVKAKQGWRQIGTQMARMLDRYDMILTPTVGEPPVPVGSLEPGKSDRRSMKLISSWAGKVIMGSKKMTYSILEELVRNMMKGLMPFTMVANVTGQPAMSAPLHWTDDGMPCGLQFLGRMGDEAGLFRLAGQLEAAEPWVGRTPRMTQ
jgi:amidase